MRMQFKFTRIAKLLYAYLEKQCIAKLLLRVFRNSACRDEIEREREKIWALHTTRSACSLRSLAINDCVLCAHARGRGLWVGVHAWRGMSVYIHNIYNYDWSIILQGSPDICVTSVDEPHLFIAIGEVYISIVLCYNLHELVGERNYCQRKQASIT